MGLKHLRLRQWLVLGVAILASLATSMMRHVGNLKLGNYNVNSDCPGAESQGLLTILEDPEDGKVQLVDAQRFGFPANEVTGRKAKDSEATAVEVRSGSQSCKVVTWSDNDNEYLFVCFDGDSMRCTIFLKGV